MGSFYIGSQKVCPAVVTSPSGASIPLEVSAQGILQKPTTSFTWSLPNTVTDIGAYGLYYAFYGATGLTSADLSSLTSISGNNALYYTFRGCSNLTSINLSNLTTTSGMNTSFGYCTSLTSVDLGNLTTISGSLYSVFTNCSNLASVNLNKLTVLTASAVFSYAFDHCTSLTTLSFPALTSTSFGSYTNQFSNMLHGVTGCTVHFPSNLQSVIGSWSDVTAGFGGTNTTILFDLPATT